MRDEICVFTKSIVFKQQIYCSFLRKTGVGVGVKKLVIFCRCHNCMITNVKKVMVLVMFLVQVLQWNSFPHLLLVYVRSKWKVTENIFYFQEWHQNAQLQIFIQANSTMGTITKSLQKRSHLLSGCFIKVFYKMTACPRRPLFSGPKGGCLIHVWP